MAGAAFSSILGSVRSSGYFSFSYTTSLWIFFAFSSTGVKSYCMVLALSVPLSPYNVNDHGYSGSAGVPQLRCSHTQFRSSNSNKAVWVSAIFDLPSLSTKIPPREDIFFGQPSFNIHLTVSSMWIHMSPIMPLPYSINDRQRRGWTIAL